MVSVQIKCSDLKAEGERVRTLIVDTTDLSQATCHTSSIGVENSNLKTITDALAAGLKTINKTIENEVSIASQLYQRDLYSTLATPYSFASNAIITATRFYLQQIDESSTQSPLTIAVKPIIKSSVELCGDILAGRLNDVATKFSKLKSSNRSSRTKEEKTNVDTPALNAVMKLLVSACLGPKKPYITGTELSALKKVTTAATTVNLKKLESAGLIESAVRQPGTDFRKVFFRPKTLGIVHAAGLELREALAGIAAIKLALDKS